jgi:restriction system protein
MVGTMTWKDRNALGTRTVFSIIRGAFRLRTLARELRNVSGLVVAAVVFAVLALSFGSWILFGSLIAVLLLSLGQWLYFRYYIARAGLEDVDEMTGWEFEKWLNRLFERCGFGVERTPYRGDFGADFVLTWNTRRIAVQAKRASRPVGVRAVQEVVAARAYYRCDQAMVVTNSYFTAQAVILGRANNVLMRSRDDLAREAAALGGATAIAIEINAPIALHPQA